MGWNKKRDVRLKNQQWKPLVKAYLLSAKVDRKVVEAANGYMDELADSHDKVDYQYNLAGQIRRGEQLQMDPAAEQLTGLVQGIEALSRSYVSQFFDAHPIGSPIAPDRIQPEIQDIWGVYQRAHDYNPLHNHGTRARMGLSGCFYVQVPSCIDPSAREGVTMARGAKGDFDGHLYLNYGELRPFGSIMLEPPLSMHIAPAPGVMLLWPAWLNHGVRPFDGEGERRCIAYNVNVMITEG
ncbi:MAG: putative 2OG-Fe(II) oxygenase [Myxococcota bacterium]|jgi:hypothetical protein|nr:putative 2OG-Fe(II) oxygenase [Myxococcota bacterium]